MQADALETLVQVFFSQKKFLRMHSFEKESLEVKPLRRHYNILKTLLLLKGSENHLEYCYRPSQFTQRLLKKLKLISACQVKATSSEEQKLARKFKVEREVFQAPKFIPHNFARTVSVSNNPFAASFKLLKDAKSSTNSFMLPGTETSQKKSYEVGLFPIARKESVESLKEGVEKPMVWNLMNEKMQLESQLEKTITKELFNLRLWDEAKSGPIESPHLLITPNTVASWQQEHIQSMRTVLYGSLQ